MSKAFLIGIVIFLLGCSAGSLSVDATDYASLCKQAEQEGKNVVVLVTAADCPVCHGLLREWTGCREWAEWQREHVLLCHTALSDTANLFPRLLNTMAVPLVVVVSPDRRIQYAHTGFISATKLKQVINGTGKGHVGSSILSNHLYTTSPRELYRLFSDVLAVQFGLQQQPIDREQVTLHLQHSLEIEPYFMNRYLEWKYYRAMGDVQRADSCRVGLLNTLSDEDKILYAPEIMELNPALKLVGKDEDRIFPEDYNLEWGEKDREITFEIPYENKSAKPLIIVSVKQSCNCLNTFWDSSPLAVHGKSRIKVVYHNKGEGVSRKKIQVYTNDPGSPYEITLHGRLKK
nr:DUF1573 domain-containing protein [Odoribacter splanchnicus]